MLNNEYIFIRHGQTYWNKNGIMHGQYDIPLNETGRNQAKKISNELKNVRFDICFSSPLIRAKSTAIEILKNHRNVKIIYDERLKELYKGKLEGKHVNGEKLLKNEDKYILEKYNIESKKQFFTRVSELINDIARNIGLDYFFEYEDDYTNFQLRYIQHDSLKGNTIRRLDEIFDLMISCLNDTKSNTLAFAQGGDFIGGAGSFHSNNFKRKAMNSFVFKVNKDKKDDILFIGRMNDDVNTYLTQGKIGKLFFQIASINLVQLMTQSNTGGNTEAYLKYGTYVKSFYSVICAPSCCKISTMGRTDKRIHHSIKWINAVPVILNEKYKKTV